MNRGDIDGLVARYEPHAALALAGGRTARGAVAIREAYAQLVADSPMFPPGQPLPTLRSGDLALTSTRLVDGTVTAKVACRQLDGTWLWVLVQPNVVGAPDVAQPPQ